MHAHADDASMRTVAIPPCHQQRAMSASACPVQAFGQMVTEQSIQEGIRKQVASTVAHMQATQGLQVSSAVQQLPPDQRGALSDLTNHH